MSQDPEQYPKVDVGDHQPELIIRDFKMHNYHVNSHKMRWLKDVIEVADAHRFKDDFDHEIDTTNDWELNRGAEGTYECQDEVNGVLAICTIEEENDYIELTQHNESWKLADCYPFYTEARIKISSITESVFWFGLTQGNTWFTHPDNWLVFLSPSGSADIEFLSNSGGEAYADYGPYIDTGIDYVADTWFRLGLHWDGEGTVRWFVIEDGDAPQTILATGTRTTYIPQDTELTLGFGIFTDDADDKCLSIDYITASQLRVIE